MILSNKKKAKEPTKKSDDVEGDRKIKTSAIHLLSPTARSTMRLLLLLAALLAASSFKSYEEETASDEWDKALNMADKNNDEKLEKGELDDIAGQWVYDGPGVRKALATALWRR